MHVIDDGGSGGSYRNEVVGESAPELWISPVIEDPATYHKRCSRMGKEILVRGREGSRAIEGKRKGVSACSTSGKESVGGGLVRAARHGEVRCGRGGVEEGEQGRLAARPRRQREGGKRKGVWGRACWAKSGRGLGERKKYPFSLSPNFETLFFFLFHTHDQILMKHDLKLYKIHETFRNIIPYLRVKIIGVSK